MESSSPSNNKLKSQHSYMHGRQIPPPILKKPLKSPNSYSTTFPEDQYAQSAYFLEQTPGDSSTASSPSVHQRGRGYMPQSPEVIVKIDAAGEQSRPNSAVPSRENSRRESSLDFWKNNDSNSPMQPQKTEELIKEDPTAKLIGQFLDKQKAAGGELTLDMDLEMDELRNGQSSTNSNDFLSPAALQNYDYNNNFSPSTRVSFQAPRSNSIYSVDVATADEPKDHSSKHNKSSSSSSEDDYINQSVHNRRRSSNMGNSDSVHNYYTTNNNGDEGSVLRCTSIQKRFSGIGRMKTRSRLMDPPEVPESIKSGLFKSGQMPRSGLLVRASGMLGKPGDDDDDDPLVDDQDIPDEFKKSKFDLLTMIQWVSLILLLVALVCTLIISEWKTIIIRGLSLWKWEVLVLVLICGRLVSGWFIKIVVFFIERSFFMRKRILYFVYGIRSAVQNCLWLGLVLIAWNCMFDKKVDGNNKFLQYVNKVMLCCLVGTLLWLVKTLMVKVLASSFHVSTFFDRIQESLFNQYVIEALSGPPLVEIRNNQEEEEKTMAEIWRLKNAGATLPPDLTTPSTYQKAKSGKANGGSVGGGLPPKPTKGLSLKISGPLPKTGQDDQVISIDHLHKLNNKNVSAWNMKRLMNFVRNGALTTLDEQALSSCQDDDASTAIMSEREARAAAKKIFGNVAKPKAKYIYFDDLLRFLREEEALKTLNLVEGSAETEKIRKSSLKNWVVNAFRERRALTLTLNDTKTAVKKLHHMVNVIVATIILLICLVILEIATSKFLLFLSSEIVVVAFIFGNTCKQIFEAIIFVFVIHPFDVGDRCEVDGVQMIVEEMNILTTVFLKADNHKIIYPNVTLATRPISNFYRSPDMGDTVEFSVHIATPAEKIALMKQRITGYIEGKSEYWYPSPSIVLMNLEGLYTLKLSLWLRHRMNHQDMGEKWKRRAILVEEMVKIFKELDIEYRLYPLDINVRSLPTPNSNRMPSTWASSPRN